MTKTVDVANRKIEQGFSLIELMIAMLLGLILIAGVINLFLASSQTYRLQEAMFRVQESGRFALDVMLRDLRDAGFQNLLPINASRNTSITAIQGFPLGAKPGDLPVGPPEGPPQGLPGRVVAGVTSEIPRATVRSWQTTSSGRGPQK